MQEKTQAKAVHHLGIAHATMGDMQGILVWGRFSLDIEEAIGARLVGVWATIVFVELACGLPAGQGIAGEKDPPGLLGQGRHGYDSTRFDIDFSRAGRAYGLLVVFFLLSVWYRV